MTDWAARLREYESGDAIEIALRAALRAVDPGPAVSAVLEGDGPALTIAGTPLPTTGRVEVFAIGKAAVAMARPVLGRLRAAGRSARATVVTKVRPRQPIAADLFVAGHPHPTAASVAAAQAVGARADALTGSDLAVVLLSGGASSLLCAPKLGLRLVDLVATTDLLLRGGVDVHALNTVRRRLDALKGGGLARRIAPARLVTLVLSDVVDDDLAAVGSGPTVPDPTTAADALEVLAPFGDAVPSAVLAALRADSVGTRPDLAGAVTRVVASNATAVTAATDALGERGFRVMHRDLDGDAAEAGRALGIRCVPGIAVVAGGETVVSVVGDGHGGRNQHLALAAALALDAAEGHGPVTVVGFATDGEDGPTDAAGAVATETTAARARALGLDPAAALAGTDSYPIFAALGDLLQPGSTGTNVCDLAIATHGRPR